MSRNYDNWERLVAAVVKRDQIWQLCHQDSISICSESSSDLEFSLPISLGSFGIADSFELKTSNLAQNLQEYVGRGSKSVVRLLDDDENVTEREYEEQMMLLGNSRHENVGIPQTTKFVVYDSYNNIGSVFDMLHGDRSRPDWESRMRIAVGAARGIAHIHAQCGGKLSHGNINSSNVFLNRQQYGCVSADFCLEGVTGSPQRCDELQKGDVYSFGLLLLELVIHNCISPFFIVDHLRSFELSERDMSMIFFHGPYVDELDMIISSGTFEFVAGELSKDSEVLEELVKMLRVAKRCLAELAQDRPTMSDVVLMLDTIRYKQDRPRPRPTMSRYKQDVSQGVSRDFIAKKRRVWQKFLPFSSR